MEEMEATEEAEAAMEKASEDQKGHTDRRSGFWDIVGTRERERDNSSLQELKGMASFSLDIKERDGGRGYREATKAKAKRKKQNAKRKSRILL